ncbi:hypothetical protein N8Z01_19510 [Enterobacter hormaechei subsp. hoffmannii]|nr:hypothetical protein [Enterobacter hormaechei subsp. hoffmannii]MCU3684755.1 hypothetical protein [Enterobacter hormaechei subsp. hoffmannii]MCU3699055.1 hypothetical protein [Enterobacter hormaechei subsp. hoffmannii]
MSNIDKQAQEEKTREAFEQWAEQSGALPWGILKKHRNEDGSYPGPHYTYMWHAWNACTEALLDELEAKDSTIATQQQEIRTLLNALGQSSEKRNSDLPDQKRIIGWRASDYTDETSDPELAKNWAAAIGVLPIFEGDVNTKLSAAAAGKGEAS